MMDNTEFIALSDFCESHDITSTFVIELQEYGLIQVVNRNNDIYIPIQELPKAEKIVRLYLDLDINLEGIEVIENLLEKMQNMQREITLLKNHLRNLVKF